MDPITIAAGAVALLGPFVSHAAQEFAGAAGQAVWKKTEALFSMISNRLGGDKNAKQSIDDFVRDPAAGAEGFRATLATSLASNPEFLKQVSDLLAEVKQAGPQIKVVQRMQEAQGVVGVKAKSIKKGGVDVTQEIGKASGTVVGVQIDEDIGQGS